MIKTYYLLTKPGIIAGNLLTMGSAFVLASRGCFDPWLFLATVTGLFCVIASACVCNNYVDRHADGKMARTKNRALVRGLVSTRGALFFAVSLGLLGFSILAFYTGLLATMVALCGFVIYVVLYSCWKYQTSYATLVGSIAGATPPIVGYCAVSHCFDMGAAILFMILVLWQMPHFFSIAVYRREEYAAAAIPVLPLVKGLYATKMQMLLYIIAFMVATAMLLAFGYAGYTYLIVAIGLSCAWLWLCIKGFKTDNDRRWARKMFQLSLMIIVLLSFMICIDGM